MRKFLALGRDNDGAVALEFAFIAPVFIAFMLVLFDLSRAYLIRSSIDNALSEAGRYALVYSSATDAQLVSKVTSSFHVGTAANLQVTSTTQAINGKNYHVIAASYPVSSLTGHFISRGAVTLHRTVSIPINP